MVGIGPLDTWGIGTVSIGTTGSTQKMCTTLSRTIRALTSSIWTSGVSFKEWAVQVEQCWNGLEPGMDGEAKAD